MTEQSENSLEPDARRRAGHYEILGETYAKFEFFENGWNPYSRFLDVDKVDLILRRRDSGHPIYREVQVKYGKLHQVGWKWERPLFDVTSWRFFREGEFDDYLDHKDFFIAYVLAGRAKKVIPSIREIFSYFLFRTLSCYCAPQFPAKIAERSSFRV